MVRDGAADACIAGIDLTSREVIISAKAIIGTRQNVETFSSLFVIELSGKKYILTDGATCKHPTRKQLADIIILVNEAAGKILGHTPKIALLSFSTFGSGGEDESIHTIKDATELVKVYSPDIKVDGEMQLDAAVNPAIAKKKAAGSPVAGQADVLVCPDINSGNILYKGLEQLAGAKAYGPILLGFNKPVSDLSRGSTEEDIVGTIQALISLI
ncbi:MAG: phosphate acetyltransferase [Candidatus Nomurabacteria bacterium]|nr:phosphate acetyltransferase [Candidatus Nomurabacteria bacterium]